MLFLTSTECRTIAEKKLAEAGRDERHCKRLTTAAAGWLFSPVNGGASKSPLDMTRSERRFEK
jgi:hypothetical protein